jgi:hypothetical protein
MFGTNSAAARWCERGEARRSPISAATMGVFVIACPQTGKKFATGIQVERDDLADTDATTVATSFCPHSTNGATATPNTSMRCRQEIG